MKKLMTIVCAAALLGMVGCGSDDKKPENGGGGGEQPQTMEGEGVYNPAVKIDRVHYSDTTADEVWQWDGNRLTGVNVVSANGSQQSSVGFTYDADGRVQSVSGQMMGMQVVSTPTYNAQKLISNMSIMAGYLDAANAQVQHNENKKVNHISLDIHDEVIDQLLQLLSALMGSENNPFAYMTTAPAASKLSVEDKSFDADIIWSGDNATRLIIGASLDLSITLNEIPLDLLQTLAGEEYASMIGMAVSIMGDTPLPVRLTVADTIDYAYDNKNNPLLGYMGEVSVASLSANNITSSSAHGKASISANVELGMLGSLPLNYDYPLNDMGTESFSYTYTQAGYPHVVTDADGVSKEYIYQE